MVSRIRAYLHISLSSLEFAISAVRVLDGPSSLLANVLGVTSVLFSKVEKSVNGTLV